MIKYFSLAITIFFIAYTSIFIYFFGKPSNMSRWVNDAYTYKIAQALAIKEPKIVISGGSNALFGIDSTMLSNHFKKPAINIGVNAGVMTPLILDYTKQALKSGDTLILSLEYSLYLYDEQPNDQMIDYILSYYPALFFKLTLKEQFYIYWHTTLKSMLQKLAPPLTPSGVYGIHNIDKNGDQINTDDSIAFEATPFVLTQPFKRNEAIRALILYCQANNISIIFTPPPHLKQDIYSEDKKYINFFNDIQADFKKQNTPYIANPYDYMYDRSHFFNTDYHLNKNARTKHTKKLIHDLELAIKKL